MLKKLAYTLEQRLLHITPPYPLRAVQKRALIDTLWAFGFLSITLYDDCSHVPHNDVLVNDRLHIR